MKNHSSQVLYRSLNYPPRFKRPVLVLTSLALALVLSACNKHDDAKTAGQKLDSAIDQTEQAAALARAKTEQSAVQAKAKTEAAFANAGEALKNAASAAKGAASKASEKIDDMAITAAVSSGLAKDPDLSAFKINVDTKDGAVILNGSAPTEAARERAGTIAKTVNGVHSVDNKLTLKAG